MLREFFEANFKDALIKEDSFRDQQSFYVRNDRLFDICHALFNDMKLDVKFLIDICALDWLGNIEEESGRFEVIYNFMSLSNKYRFFIKVKLSANKPEIDSISSIWKTANWLEREVYDLMGVIFIGHPNLTKIVTPDELEGHPHRKDFPQYYEMPRFTHNKNEPPEVIL
ncbi:MAG: NADH-quinone oxidoreductase subunit C [Candidatus Zixiibacteriota bacterium]